MPQDFPPDADNPVESAGLDSGSATVLSTEDTNRTQPVVTISERRRMPRYDCDGRAEIARIPSTGTRKGKLGNISVTGCFIETDDPFSPGTYVEVTLQMAALSLRIAGSVKNLRTGGMGIAFPCLRAH